MGHPVQDPAQGVVRPARDICYYDGKCGFCRRSAGILRSLDWLGRLDFVDQTTVSDAELPVPRDAALKGMPMFTRGGLALVGFPAMRRALVQTPLGFVPALVMYVPVLNVLARMAYDCFAARRGRDTCDTA